MVVKGDKFAVHRAQSPAVALSGIGSRYDAQMSGRARLRLPVRVRTQTGGHVGERVGSAVGEDVLFGHLQDGNAGGHFVQAAADHGFL